MPPWNKPNSADTTYSDTSPSNGRNSSSATPCSTEPSSSVRRPPMRSEIQPEASRLTMPQAEHQRQHFARRARRRNPRSPQYATMCTCGIDIATQHATPAMHSSVCSAAGDSPSGRSARGCLRRRAARRRASGGRRRSTSASGSIVDQAEQPDAQIGLAPADAARRNAA